MQALDTETNGLDFSHGKTFPFFVTICDEDLNIQYFEWEVDPLTRKPEIPQADIEELREIINSEEQWVGQNFKFDMKALDTINVFNESCVWDWDKTNDTLIAGHLLASNAPHDLTSMALMELGINIKPYEDRLRDAVNEARRWARSNRPDWKIAKKGLEGMPSAKESVWQYDMWLPRAVAKEEGYEESHPWWTVLAEYSNADSSVTLPLMKRQLEKIEKRGLTKIYQERLKLLPIVYEMEKNGLTINRERTFELKNQYIESTNAYQNICCNVADNEIESLPVNGASNALKHVLFNKFGLVSSKKTPAGAQSTDKFVLDAWMDELPTKSKAFTFIKHLRAYRRRKTALSYIDSYENYWISVDKRDPTSPWMRLFPSLNQTGTKTLRFSGENPNPQQCSKQDIEEILDGGEVSSHNARYMFGPLPGEEWWSCDAQNIELRLPAYKAGEQLMIDLFERPEDPPYFGSVHLLNFDTLHPEKFAEHGAKVKKIYAATWYQWTKNGGFADQYGAMLGSGTADRAFHVVGGQAMIKSRLSKIAELSRQQIAFAEKHGYIVTMPDINVDPEHGYPLYCTLTKYGAIMPTVPLSYYIQGSAMWWMSKAMVRVSDFLKELNRSDRLFKQLTGRFKTEHEKQIGYRMVTQIHDEIIYCFPQGIGREKWKTNRPIVKEIQRIMALGGDDINIPTPVSASWHPNNWGEESPIDNA